MVVNNQLGSAMRFLAFLQAVFASLGERVWPYFRPFYRGSLWCGRNAVRGSMFVTKAAVATAGEVALAPFYAIGAAMAGSRPAQARAANIAERNRSADLADLERQLVEKAAKPKPTFKPPHSVAIEQARRIANGKPVEWKALDQLDPFVAAWIAALTVAGAHSVLAVPQGAVFDHITGRRRSQYLPPMLEVKRGMDRVEREFGPPVTTAARLGF
jgi:hypothetical protein